MRDLYRIRYLGAPEGPILEIVRQFGPTKVVKLFRSSKRHDVFIVDCEHNQHCLSPKLIRSVLDSGQTLGLLNMDSRDRTALASITGRTFSDTIIHVFVRTKSGSPSEFTYTILPTYDWMLSELPVRVAKYLRQRVFTLLSGGGHYAFPDREQNWLWQYPNNRYNLQAIQGSTIDLFANQVCNTNTLTIGGFGDISQTATISAKAYVYRNVSGNYHAIIVSHIIGASPVVAEHHGVGGSSTDYGYAVGVTPMQNGTAINGVSIQQPFPQPASVGNDSHIGHFIQILFQDSFVVRAQNADGNIGPQLIEPYYKETIGQAAFPTVGDFEITNTVDNQTVRFASDSGMWQSLTNEEVKQDQPDRVASIQATPPITPLSFRQFTTIHYMIFDSLAPGSTSFPITFQFTVTLGISVYMYDYPEGSTTVAFTPTTISSVVDLAQATKMHAIPQSA